MCHLVADSREELYAIVDSIGVERKWIQDFGTYREHFDICHSKRILAVKFGAIEVSTGRLARILEAKKVKY